MLPRRREADESRSLEEPVVDRYVVVADVAPPVPLHRVVRVVFAGRDVREEVNVKVEAVAVLTVEAPPDPLIGPVLVSDTVRDDVELGPVTAGHPTGVVGSDPPVRARRVGHRVPARVHVSVCGVEEVVGEAVVKEGVHVLAPGDGEVVDEVVVGVVVLLLPCGTADVGPHRRPEDAQRRTVDDGLLAVQTQVVTLDDGQEDGARVVVPHRLAVPRPEATEPETAREEVIATEDEGRPVSVEPQVTGPLRVVGLLVEEDAPPEGTDDRRDGAPPRRPVEEVGRDVGKVDGRPRAGEVPGRTVCHGQRPRDDAVGTGDVEVVSVDVHARLLPEVEVHEPVLSRVVRVATEVSESLPHETEPRLVVY